MLVSMLLQLRCWQCLASARQMLLMVDLVLQMVALLLQTLLQMLSMLRRLRLMQSLALARHTFQWYLWIALDMTLQSFP